MSKEMRKLKYRWEIMRLAMFWLEVKEKIYKLFPFMIPADEFEPIETDEDVQELIDALNQANKDPDIKLEMACTRCLKTWNPGHKCEEQK